MTLLLCFEANRDISEIRHYFATKPHQAVGLVLDALQFRDSCRSEYINGLTKKVRVLEKENEELRKKVSSLQNSVQSLQNQQPSAPIPTTAIPMTPFMGRSQSPFLSRQVSFTPRPPIAPNFKSHERDHTSNFESHERSPRTPRPRLAMGPTTGCPPTPRLRAKLDDFMSNHYRSSGVTTPTPVTANTQNMDTSWTQTTHCVNGPNLAQSSHNNPPHIQYQQAHFNKDPNRVHTSTLPPVSNRFSQFNATRPSLQMSVNTQQLGTLWSNKVTPEKEE